MAKKDTVKTAKYELWAYEWQADQMPSKRIRSIKRKERQAGKKVIAKERKDLGK